MTKKFCHPDVVQSSHDLEGNKKPLSHFSSGDHIYEGMLSFSPHAPLQYFLLPDEADFFSFLLNFKCRHWRFICFTASKEKRDPIIEQHLN